MASAVPPVMLASPMPPTSSVPAGNVPPPIIFGQLLEVLPESEACTPPTCTWDHDSFDNRECGLTFAYLCVRVRVGRAVL